MERLDSLFSCLPSEGKSAHLFAVTYWGKIFFFLPLLDLLQCFIGNLSLLYLQPRDCAEGVINVTVLLSLLRIFFGSFFASGGKKKKDKLIVQMKKTWDIFQKKRQWLTETDGRCALKHNTQLKELKTKYIEPLIQCQCFIWSSIKRLFSGSPSCILFTLTIMYTNPVI